LTVNGRSKVNAVKKKCLQAVHVVMANAFKYTRKGSVTMDTEASADEQYVTFKVRV
jgi:hypothetical protein